MRPDYLSRKHMQKVEPEKYGPEAGHDVKRWQKRVLDIITILLIVGVLAWLVITVAL